VTTTTITDSPSSQGLDYTYWVWGWTENSDAIANRNGEYALIHGQSGDLGISTSNFTSSDYISWPTQTLPPDNATILWVHLLVYVATWVGYGHTFYLQYATNTTWADVSSASAVWHNGANTTKTMASMPPPGHIWNEYSSNVTTNETWTPQMLKSSQTWIRLMMAEDTVWPLYVDYIGLEYAWSVGGGSGSGGGDVGNIGIFQMPDVLGLIGVIGFIGVIGIPAASIWFFRRDGGSKVYAGVMALVAFTFCAGLFLASIQGG
jgi:hypothetical protein